MPEIFEVKNDTPAFANISAQGLGVSQQTVRSEGSFAVKYADPVRDLPSNRPKKTRSSA